MVKFKKKNNNKGQFEVADMYEKRAMLLGKKTCFFSFHDQDLVFKKGKTVSKSYIMCIVLHAKKALLLVDIIFSQWNIFNQNC